MHHALITNLYHDKSEIDTNSMLHFSWYILTNGILFSVRQTIMLDQMVLSKQSLIKFLWRIVFLVCVYTSCTHGKNIQYILNFKKNSFDEFRMEKRQLPNYIRILYILHQITRDLYPRIDYSNSHFIEIANGKSSQITKLCLELRMYGNIIGAVFYV